MSENYIEHAEPKNPLRDEFLKVYFALTILYYAVSVISGLYLILTETDATNSAFQLFSFAMAILALAVFIMSIIAWVQFKKKQYSKSLILVPKLSVLLPVALIILGGIAGVIAVRSIDISSFNLNSPTADAEITEAVAAHPVVQAINWIGLMLNVIILGYAAKVVNDLRQQKSAQTQK